jgi:hypothetical protein
VTGEGFFEAELHRLRGLALQDVGRISETEDEWRRAVLVAQQEQARWWGLRAVVNLAELLRNGDRHADACAALKPIFDWFVEGLTGQT